MIKLDGGWEYVINQGALYNLQVPGARLFPKIVNNTIELTLQIRIVTPGEGRRRNLRGTWHDVGIINPNETKQLTLELAGRLLGVRKSANIAAGRVGSERYHREILSTPKPGVGRSGKLRGRPRLRDIWEWDRSLFKKDK